MEPVFSHLPAITTKTAVWSGYHLDPGYNTSFITQYLIWLIDLNPRLYFCDKASFSLLLILLAPLDIGHITISSEEEIIEELLMPILNPQGLNPPTSAAARWRRLKMNLALKCNFMDFVLSVKCFRGDLWSRDILFSVEVAARIGASWRYSVNTRGVWWTI